MTDFQAGEALNDIGGVAFLLCAAALLVNGHAARGHGRSVECRRARVRWRCGRAGGRHEAVVPCASRGPDARGHRHRAARRANPLHGGFWPSDASRRRLLVPAKPRHHRKPDPLHRVGTARLAHAGARFELRPGFPLRTTGTTRASGGTGSSRSWPRNSDRCGRWSCLGSLAAEPRHLEGPRADPAGARRGCAPHGDRLRLHPAHGGRGGGQADRLRVEYPLPGAGRRDRPGAPASVADVPCDRAPVRSRSMGWVASRSSPRSRSSSGRTANTERGRSPPASWSSASSAQRPWPRRADMWDHEQLEAAPSPSALSWDWLWWVRASSSSATISSSATRT